MRDVWNQPEHERALHGRAHIEEFVHTDALKLYAHLDSRLDGAAADWTIGLMYSRCLA